MSSVSRDLAESGPGVLGRVNLGSDTWFSSVVNPGAQVVFAAIRPNIYMCFVVYEPKKHLRDIHPSVFRTFMM